MKRKYIRYIILITSILILSYSSTSCSNIVSIENNNIEISENMNGVESLNNGLGNDIIIDKGNDNKLNEDDNNQLISEPKKSFKEEVDNIVTSLAGEYKNNLAVYCKNLNSNEIYELNLDNYYFAASISKVPLSMMALDEAYKGNISLEQTIRFRESDREGGTGVLYYLDSIPDITVREAVKLAIVNSDNIAHNMLIRFLGRSATDYMREINNDYEIPYGNYTTARQVSVALNRLYYNEENNPYYDELIQYMKETQFHDRLDKYLPNEIVAHKIGSYSRYYHDIGIIYGKEPYILIILTKDINVAEGEYANEDDGYLLDGGEKAIEFIANISKEIYTKVMEN